MGRDIALTGLPRGGTSLACAILAACADTVALSEPMDVLALPAGIDAALDAVQSFFDDSRTELLRHGTATSLHRDGNVPDNYFTSAGGSRHRDDLSLGKIVVKPEPRPGFTLVLKHNAAFAALLPGLAQRFETIAIVRNPLAALASWHSVFLPVSEGRVPAAERLLPDLARRLDAEPDLVGRQLILLDWFFGQFLAHLPAHRILRYEEIVASQGDLLRQCAGVNGARGTPLREKNANPDYAQANIAMLAERLAATPGAWRALYPTDTIAPLLARMRAAIDAA